MCIIHTYPPPLLLLLRCLCTVQQQQHICVCAVYFLLQYAQSTRQRQVEFAAGAGAANSTQTLYVRPAASFQLCALPSMQIIELNSTIAQAFIAISITYVCIYLYARRSPQREINKITAFSFHAVYFDLGMSCRKY